MTAGVVDGALDPIHFGRRSNVGRPPEERPDGIRVVAHLVETGVFDRVESSWWP